MRRSPRFTRTVLLLPLPTLCLSGDLGIGERVGRVDHGQCIGRTVAHFLEPALHGVAKRAWARSVVPVMQLAIKLRRIDDVDPIQGAVAVGKQSGEERKSVVSGTSVSVRVDLGGRRIIKKKNNYNIIKKNNVQE